MSLFREEFKSFDWCKFWILNFQILVAVVINKTFYLSI